MLLADMSLRGELALDDPLSRHLPAPRPAWRHREPTLLELATHRSGLPNTPRSMGRRELLVLSNTARSVDRLGFRLIESSTFGEEDGR